jgi:phosphomannomutase
LPLLPSRITASGRIQDFPAERSRAFLAELDEPGGLEAFFGPVFGVPEQVDRTDGLRLTFASGEVVHLRPSGNAPEFRCYTEADTEARAEELLRLTMRLLSGEAG